MSVLVTGVEQFLGKAPATVASAADKASGVPWQGPVRLAEIAVLSPTRDMLRSFVEALCGSAQYEHERIILGRSSLTEQIDLQVYGIHVEGAVESLSLDLLASRMLGAIALYPWGSPEEQEFMEEAADWYEENYEAPLLIVATVADSEPFPQKVFQKGVYLGSTARLVACHLEDPASVRSAIVTLVDMALSRVPG